MMSWSGSQLSVRPPSSSCALCLHSAVDELLRQRSNKPIRQPSENVSKGRTPCFLENSVSHESKDCMILSICYSYNLFTPPNPPPPHPLLLPSPSTPSPLIPQLIRCRPQNLPHMDILLASFIAKRVHWRGRRRRGG